MGSKKSKSPNRKKKHLKRKQDTERLLLKLKMFEVVIEVLKLISELLK